MTPPEPFSSRPVPDVADLRLLGEIINHGAIGLSQAAWNAGMSQAEAAARLVTMAERGMPLRLVAEGDRQQLWQIAQAGPVPPFPPVPSVQPAPPPMGPTTGPLGSAAPSMALADQSAPSTGPIPRLQQDVPAAPRTSDLPAGYPPAGSEPARVSTAPTATPDADQSAVWGVPGTSSWVRPPDGTPGDLAPDASAAEAHSDAAGSEDASPEGTDSAGIDSAGTGSAGTESQDAESELPGDDGSVDSGEPSAAGEQTQRGASSPSAIAEGADAPVGPAASGATRRVLTSGQPVQAVEGLFGEHLDVGLQQILDPADTILTAVGYRIDAGERTLLVQTSVGNRGPADYESLADLYLEIVDSAGTVLPKAAMSVNGYPAHQVGVPANTLATGWTVFLVPIETEVAQVRWSVRPDLAHRTVSWGFGAAPAEQA